MSALERVLDGLLAAYAGPGGAVALLRDGEVLARRTWGWADVSRRIPFTPQTLFRVCSITKQFTCAALLSEFPDPAVLDPDLRARLPLLDQPAPGVLHLAHNQSGLRDYWATAMLCGAVAEQPFGEAESRRLIGLTRTLHFTPGTRYAYCNQNFRLLGELLEARTGQTLDALIRRHVLGPAGMGTARLVPDASGMPDGTLGYEGTVESGFRAAVTRLTWVGDAALAASLDDMIAWETFIDRTRDDAGSIYRRLSAPVSFSGGLAASYGFGLGRYKMLGRAATSHGGGLRGWCSFRCHLPAERLSAVVMFNHHADPRAAARDLLAAVLGEGAPSTRSAPDPAWAGVFEEPETGLVARIGTTPNHQVSLAYSGYRPDMLEVAADDRAEAGGTRLRREQDGLWMDRATENQSTRLLPLHGPAARDFAGTFHNAEYGATLTCVVQDGAAYGAFSGWLGEGAMQPLLPAAGDHWLFPMPRALDHAPPGDWTLKLVRNAAGEVAAIEVGCWLARRLTFKREPGG